MHSLFVKLFIWFWLASLVSGLISFMLAMNTKQSPRKQERMEHLLIQTRPVIQALSVYGGISAAALERDGVATTLTARDRDGDISAQLFTENGTPLSPETAPDLVEAVEEFASQGAPANTPYVAHSDKADLVALRVTGPSGKPYIAAGIVPSLPDHKKHYGFSLPPDMWFRIVVSIVVIGLACYVLAWWMASPIRQLRATAQQLADGDLSARVNLKIISGNNDEMVDLGRDFNRMAERIEQLISAQRQLVRDVSHELRSPLARLNVALGRARQEDGNTTAALDRIELESERLNFLISDLLTLSLLEGGGDALAKSPFALCELATEVTEDADFEAASLNRQVLLTSCEPTTLAGNRELLRRALENIVRNGVRYTKEGSAVEVTLGRDSSGYALLKIRDHGPGVPESALADIFRPFYRVAADRDRHSGGAGIGLAIAQRTVQLSGGTIVARNLSDGGLEIEMRMPLS
jgi:signal transduction histidine kinase